MGSIGRLFKRLGTLFGRDRFNSELEEEMALHREQKEAEFRAEGMTPEDAHHAAMREFGNATRLNEQSHEVVGFQFETVLQDLRFAFRQLRRRSLGFTCTAIIMLALGIGASVALFAFVDAALIKPLPYEDPTRLVDVNGEPGELLLAAIFRMLTILTEEDERRSSARWICIRELVTPFRTSTGTEPVSGARVSDGFFRTLGIKPLLGRDFYVGEDSPGAPKTVMLSYEVWQNRFGGRSNDWGDDFA